MKPTLSLSTSWCSHRHSDGYAMLSEMADLGFDHVELSHGIRITLVPGILRAVDEKLIKVSSTHNFCPLPTGVAHAAPNLFEPSASDSREHDQWLRHTRRSIDFASQLGAKALVCHLGSVKFFWSNPARALREYAEQHPPSSLAANKNYQAKLAKAVAKVKQRMNPYWEQTQESIRAVLEYAVAKDVKLGFENREKMEELPLDEDYPGFLAGLPPDAPVGYWHDTGHAQIKQLIGRLDHAQHLATMAPRLIGFHLHDVSADGEDHQPIGSGSIDFGMVSQHWRPEHLLTLEFSPRLKVEEVQDSRARVLALMRD